VRAAQDRAAAFRGLDQVLFPFGDQGVADEDHVAETVPQPHLANGVGQVTFPL